MSYDMNKKRNSTYPRIDILFLVTGLLLLFTCLLKGNKTFDLQFRESYILIYYDHIGILFFSIYTLYALVYFLIRKNLKYVLGILHLLLGTPLFIYTVLTALTAPQIPRRYYRFEDHAVGFDTFLNSTLYVIVAMFVLAQLLFIINIIFAIIKSIKFKMQ